MSTPKPMAKKSTGFTIIELLIATLVFSVILIIITSGVISLSNQYYKGITSSNTQSVARSVMDTISQDIQFSNGTLYGPFPSSDTTIKYFCTGSHQYIYKLGYQLTNGAPTPGDQSNNALVQVNQSGACSDPGHFPASGPGVRELLTPGMRLANFSLQAGALPSTWTISIRVATGDSDLLNNPHPADPVANPTTCMSTAGSQFCAISELTTTVQQRL